MSGSADFLYIALTCSHFDKVLGLTTTLVLIHNAIGQYLQTKILAKSGSWT